MAIVPRQVLADDEVIEFWKKKPLLRSDEIAPLTCGINPFAWQKRYQVAIDSEATQRIEDVLTIISQRAKGFEDIQSLQDWKLFFWHHHIPFPKSLEPPLSKRVQNRLARVKEDPEHLQKILAEVRARKGIPVLLAQWFLHDTWTEKDAMLLLAGLDPDGTLLECYESIHGEHLNRIYIAGTLDGFESAPRDIAEEDDEWSNSFAQQEHDWQFLTKLWASGNHPSKNPPSYYLQWAASKGFEIPWLAWAKANCRWPVALSNDPVEKPLTTRERTTLLLIIAALLKDAKLEWAQPSKAAGIIVAATERLGCPVSQRAIEDHLRKIPSIVDAKAR